MDGRVTQTNCDGAGDYLVPNVLSPRDLVSRPDNMDKTVLSSSDKRLAIINLFQVSQKLVSISNNGEKINDFIGLIGPADPTKLTLISALPFLRRTEKANQKL